MLYLILMLYWIYNIDLNKIISSLTAVRCSPRQKEGRRPVALQSQSLWSGILLNWVWRERERWAIGYSRDRWGGGTQESSSPSQLCGDGEVRAAWVWSPGRAGNSPGGVPSRQQRQLHQDNLHLKLLWPLKGPSWTPRFAARVLLFRSCSALCTDVFGFQTLPCLSENQLCLSELSCPWPACSIRHWSMEDLPKTAVMKIPGCCRSSSRPAWFFAQPYRIFRVFDVFMKEMQV